MTTLDEIAARTDAATEGPWETYDGNEGTDYAPLWCVANDAFHNPPEGEEAEWIGVEIYVGDKPDAEFIAHAREDVPKLVAALRAVEEWCENNQHPTTDYPEGFSSQDYALDDAARRIRAAIQQALDG